MRQPAFTVIEEPNAVPVHSVVDASGARQEDVAAFLRDLTASDRSPATIKAYAFALCAWLNFLADRGLSWERATPQELRDYVLQLRTAPNRFRQRHRPDSPEPGSINARTGKPYPAAGYQPSTINHRLSVIEGFHAFQQHAKREPGFAALGPNRPRCAHHSPLEPWPQRARGRYRQRQPRRMPRALADDLWAEIFNSLRHNRDRAMLCLLLSAGARAQELLSMRLADVDWGDQRVRLVTKGSRQACWVAASPEFFSWLRAYLAGRCGPGPNAPLWVTLRQPERPLGYSALRAVLGRVNARLGTNVTAHDFRHTCALRLAADPEVPLVDIQTHLRHRHITTTEAYLVARSEDVAGRMRAWLSQGQSASSVAQPPSPPAWSYDPADLTMLLGREGGER